MRYAMDIVNLKLSCRKPFVHEWVFDAGYRKGSFSDNILFRLQLYSENEVKREKPQSLKLLVGQSAEDLLIIGLDSLWNGKSTDPISLQSSPGIIFDMEYFMIVRFESRYRMIIEIDSMLSLMFQTYTRLSLNYLWCHICWIMIPWCFNQDFFTKIKIEKKISNVFLCIDILDVLCKCCLFSKHMFVSLCIICSWA